MQDIGAGSYASATTALEKARAERIAVLNTRLRTMTSVLEKVTPEIEAMR